MAATSPPDEDDGVMREVAEQWPKLSKATRRALAPDLAPPPLREGKPKEKKQGKARASDDGIQGDCVLGGYSAPLEERHRRRRRGAHQLGPQAPRGRQERQPAWRRTSPPPTPATSRSWAAGRSVTYVMTLQRVDENGSPL